MCVTAIGAIRDPTFSRTTDVRSDSLQQQWKWNEWKRIKKREPVRQIGGIRSHYGRKILMWLAHVLRVKNYVSSRQLEKDLPWQIGTPSRRDCRGSVFEQTKHLGQVYKSSYLWPFNQDFPLVFFSFSLLSPPSTPQRFSPLFKVINERLFIMSKRYQKFRFGLQRQKKMKWHGDEISSGRRKKKGGNQSLVDIACFDFELSTDPSLSPASQQTTLSNCLMNDSWSTIQIYSV